jgi:hypothetical protein
MIFPEGIKDLSTKTTTNGDTGHTGGKHNILIEEEQDKDHSNETSSPNMDDLIGFKAPFYYCREHLDVETVHKEEIERHILYSKVHKSP